MNGVFAVKLTWDHLNAFLGEVRASGGSETTLEEVFPGLRWLWLRRKDKIAQAVSVWRAHRSGQWRSDGEVTGESRPEYDFFEILRFFQNLLLEDYLWSWHFAAGATVPLEIHYEELSADPHAMAQRIASHLDLAGSIPNALGMARCPRRQSDDYSKQIVVRFQTDLRHLGDHDFWSPRGAEMTRWENFFRTAAWKGCGGMTTYADRGKSGVPVGGTNRGVL
jgi:LPS sulfotransferase NodH